MQRPREAGVSGWLSFWAASPARCGEAGRAASWNLVAEESSSVRADACRDGWRGSLMHAGLLVSYTTLARFIFQPQKNVLPQRTSGVVGHCY